MDGTIEAAERVFNMPVRIGVVRDVVGLKDVITSPQYSNGAGLLMYGLKMSQFKKGKTKYTKESGVVTIGKKLKKWFDEYL